MFTSVNYFFCVDGGGSNSRAKLYDIDGKILASSKTDSVNIYNDINKSISNIYQLWVNCCKKAKLNKNNIQKNTISSFGLAGGRSIIERKIIKNKFKNFKKVFISTDGYIALIAATKGNPGAIINIGTGVVSHIMLKNGKSQQLSGWGYPCGDIGGGWWIGTKLISETLRKIDEYKIDNDILHKIMIKKIGKKDLRIIEWLSNSNVKKFAKLAAIAFNKSKQSKVSRKIILEGKDEIEKILTYIIQIKKIKRIYCTGGLVRFYEPLLSRRFKKYLIYDNIDPLFGAYLISRKKCPVEKLINDEREYK